MRINDFSGKVQTIQNATAQTLVFNSGDMESQGIVAYHLTFEAGGNTFADIAAIRLKANGQTIIDITPAQLRGLYSRFAGFDLATNSQRFTIPLYLLEAPVEQLADQSQFPVGAEATLEIELNATVVAGRCTLGWTKTDIPAALHPNLLRTPMAISASQRNARYSFSTTGVLQGFGIANPAAGISRLKLVLAGIQALQVPGTDYVAAATQGDMLAEIQAYRSREDLINPLWLKVDLGLVATVGNSYFEMDVGAGWAGDAEEICIYTLKPNGEG